MDSRREQQLIALIGRVAELESRVSSLESAEHGSGANIRNVTTVNTATYDMRATDDVLHVTYTSTGAVTSLSLLPAQAMEGKTIVIKDAGGKAATNNITIDTKGSSKIDEEDTYVINADYASITLYSNGSNWYGI